MKIKDYRSYFIEVLTPIYDGSEAESFFYLILAHQHQWSRVDLALNPNWVFNETDIQYWNSILEQLKLEIPIQYLLETTSFFGLDFEVNKNVLIPRPETEELVQWILDSNSKTEKLKILDIGTGSGCIAISLAKNLPKAQVFAIDVSEKALEIATLNAKQNEVAVTFLPLNILETHDLEKEFDVIVSNPPYVRNLEKEAIKKNVLDYEPHLALFVEDDDVLIFYRKISELALKNLSDKGQLYFEINQYLGTEMVDLLHNKGFQNVALRKDIYGNDRMTKAIRISKLQ